VAKPASIAASDTTLTVNVAAGGAPLAGALVTAYKANDDYESGTTDVSGNVTLGFRPDDVGAVTLTVTAINCVPYQSASPSPRRPPLLVEGTIAGRRQRGWNVRQRRRADRRGRGRGSPIPIRNTGGTSSSSVTASSRPRARWSPSPRAR
jgi:hypothetical protein